jgi:hypothetical protein
MTSLTIAYIDLILAQGKKGNNFVVNEDVLQGEEKLG